MNRGDQKSARSEGRSGGGIIEVSREREQTRERGGGRESRFGWGDFFSRVWEKVALRSEEKAFNL